MTQAPQRQRVTASGLFAMGQSALEAGRTAEAETYFKMLEANGAFVNAAGVRSEELEAQGRFDAAEAALRVGLARQPGSHELACALGRHRLREGDFREGWALMEARPIEISGAIRGKPRLSMPEWRGEPVNSLLVLGEQGFGDQIQFARYVTQLRDQGVAVTFACAPPLVPLFEPLGVPLIATTPGASLPRCDAWTMLMSIPHLIGATLDDIPPPIPLPSATGGTGIGLMLSGNPRHPQDHRRSLPAETAARLRALPGAMSLAPEDTGARDFLETARIVAGLAEVVTVDTSMAHLAGSMGKPCRVLLPYAPDWRWLRDRADSPWYPSAVLYRQAAPGDWGPPVEAVIRDLTSS